MDALSGDGMIREPQVASPGVAPPLGYIAGVATPAPDIADLRKRFDNSRTFLAEHKRRAEEDRDFYDGKQLSPHERSILARRRQPEVIANRIRPAIDGVLGVIEAGKTDPRAFARNPGGENAADVASKTLRFIAETNRFDQIKLDCAENHQIEGVCAAIIEGDPDEVMVHQVRFDEFYWDPHSRRIDFKDARWLGIAKWMDEADVRAAFGQPFTDLGDVYSGAGDDMFADKPDDASRWVDKVRKRLLVCEEYYRDGRGEWNRCVFVAAGVLDHQPSPYTDEKGRTICPIEATTAYISRENERYGRVRDMKSLQREVNARRSRMLHIANSRQVQQIDQNAPPIDPELVRGEAARPDGVIPPGWQTAQASDMGAAQAQLLMEAKSEIERMGPTPAVLGRQDGASQSGRARLVLQQAGMTELARVLGRFEDFEQRCYRQMWMRARQFWTQPKWIRVTDDPRTPEFMQINVPQVGPVLQPVVDPQTGEPVIDPMTGQPAMQPGMGVVSVENALAEIDVDILIDSVPDTANLQQEVWQQLLELMKILPPDDPRFEMAVDMSPINDKARVIEKLKAFREQAQQQPDPAAMAMQQQAMELEAGEKQAKTASLVARARRDEAEAGKVEMETAAAMLPAPGYAARHIPPSPDEPLAVPE